MKLFWILLLVFNVAGYLVISNYMRTDAQSRNGDYADQKNCTGEYRYREFCRGNHPNPTEDIKPTIEAEVENASYPTSLK